MRLVKLFATGAEPTQLDRPETTRSDLPGPVQPRPARQVAAHLAFLQTGTKMRTSRRRARQDSRTVNILRTPPRQRDRCVDGLGGTQPRPTEFARCGDSAAGPQLFGLESLDRVGARTPHLGGGDVLLIHVKIRLVIYRSFWGVISSPAKVTGIIVEERPAAWLLAAGVAFAEFTEQLREYYASALDSMANAAKQAGVPCDTVQVEDVRPYEAIIATATDRGCDLIVMASHGRGGLSAIVLGSVTNKVLTHTKVPVLVVQ